MTIIDTIIPQNCNLNTYEVESTILERREKCINTLFAIGSHRLLGNRRQIILWWTGAENLNSNVFESRYSFLLNVWSDPNFRPFDNVSSSVQHLVNHENQDFLIRLSTSQAGGITLTFRKELGTNQIVHTRFSVNNNSSIVDSNGREHKTISSIVDWFSGYRYKSKSASPAGYVVCV